jgi:DNA-binding transcriptional ArsR family regulator
MIEWRFTPDDVARIRFAFSPLAELVRSLIVLRAPARHSLHLPWTRATRPLLIDLDLTELFVLVPVRGDTADFLTPPPASPLPEFTEELEALRRTPADRAVTEATEVLGVPAATMRRIRADPTGAAHRIADTLHTYWDLALGQHWPRVRALLEADVLWRSRRLAVGGARALFEDLHETVTWHGDRLSVADPHHHSGSLSGGGLLLAPSAMCWPTVRKMIKPYQPTITYPARGIATLWETGAPPAPDALATLIRRTRASLLIALAEPTSTTALARRLSITPGAASQHLSVPLNCGLATRSRVGRSVLYQRTRSGDMLAGAADTTN